MSFIRSESTSSITMLGFINHPIVPHSYNHVPLTIEKKLDDLISEKIEDNTKSFSTTPVKSTDEEKEKVFKLWNDSLSSQNLAIQGKSSLAHKLNVHNEANRKTNKRPNIVGHRGSVYKYPENTIRSFLASHDAHCDAVELDVFLLKCGTVVVFHGGGNDENPGDLKDYCNVDGNILDYTYEEARHQLRFNPLHEEFPCPKHTMLDEENAFIPTLEEVLPSLKHTNMKIKIELKGPDTTIPVLDVVERMNMVDQCHFSSFNHERIALLRNLRPQINVSDGTYIYKTGALFSDDVPEQFVEISQNAGASEIHLKYDTCTKDRVDQIHEAGMGSMCWFRGPIGMKEDVETKYYGIENENSEMYEMVMRTGVGAMCVNKPDVLFSLFDTATMTNHDIYHI